MHLHGMEDRPELERSCWENRTAPATRRGDNENQSVRSLGHQLARNTSAEIGLRFCRGHFGDQREPLEHFTRGIALRQ